MPELNFNILAWAAGITVPLFYLTGFVLAVDAIMKTRTPQGATAWTLALISMPFLSVPLYWIFGRAKFGNYVRVLRDFDSELKSNLGEFSTIDEDFYAHPKPHDDARTRGELQAFENLCTLSFTRGNSTRLLIDGDDTFAAIFKGIDNAEDYVLAQYYIVMDDDLGQQFKERLMAALDRGVRVYLLYDEVGSYKLDRSYKKELRKSGAEVSGFSGNRSWLGRFRLNFRNHRKIVVVDGKLAFMGGLNVGDSYRGRHKRLTPWRDTHLEVRGPAVFGLQYSFVRDWYYGRKEIPEVVWNNTTPTDDDQHALILASGPADEMETCGLLFTHAIESAEERVWIASPYFVPDARVLGALQLAALRGVDVRILMPRITDHFFFKYVPYAYLPEAERAGVKIYLYEEGFMHQKVFLVDDDYAAVSTANFDNRSFMYNFEITCLLRDDHFCAEVESMLKMDFSKATIIHGEDLSDRSRLFRLATQVTRLFAPVL